MFDEQIEFVAVKTKKSVFAERESVFVFYFYAEIFRQDIQFASVIAADEKYVVALAYFPEHF
jgi:hypothetical protein